MTPRPRTSGALGALLALALLAPAQRAVAVIGAVDTVPAATLLFPYFEVDLNNPNGQTTVLAITNARFNGLLCNVVIWSDLAVPVFRYNLYLTGYDIQTINLRDMLSTGLLPRTASAGQDPSDTISNKGPFSQDINYATCTGVLPPANLDAATVTDLQKALTGLSSTSLGGCAGRAYGDGIARGYVTVDTVSACGAVTPQSAGYFTSYTTIQNDLLGDYTLINPGQNFSQGEVAAHIEASSTDPLVTTSGNYTFYGRYVGGLATDRREPLATTWAANVIKSVSSQGSNLIVWRDDGRSHAAFPCGTGVSPYPLSQSQIVTFDTQSNGVLSAETPFPWATQKISVGNDVSLATKVGFLYLNLNTTTAAGQFGPIKQSWVVVQQYNQGRFSGAFTPTVLGKASTGSNVSLSPIPARAEEGE